MKFSWKICVSVLAFSLLIVGIGGYALLSALFQSSFQREVKSAADENRMLQYSFAAYWTTTVQDRSSGFPETDVRRAAQAMQEGMSGTELRFQLYNQEGRELYDSGAEEILRDSQREALFSAASGETGARMMVRTGEGFGLATVSTVLMEDGTLLYLETDRDVTALFADRESQYGIYRRWMAGLLLLQGLGCYLIAVWLLRPLGRLSRASRRIAGGNLEVRAKVETGPEPPAALRAEIWKCGQRWRPEMRSASWRRILTIWRTTWRNSLRSLRMRPADRRILSEVLPMS